MKRKLLFVGVAVVGAVLVLVAGSPVFADCYRVINCNHYTNACNACGGDGPFPCGVR